MGLLLGRQALLGAWGIRKEGDSKQARRVRTSYVLCDGALALVFTAVGVQRSGGTVALFTCSLAPKPLYFICIYIFYFFGATQSLPHFIVVPTP